MYSISLFFIIINTAPLVMSEALIGYDCSHPDLNITTIALDSVPPCDIETDEYVPSSQIIQLIQLSDLYPLHVYQCKIEIERSATYCGMHSHSSEVLGGRMTYILSVSRTQCLEIHRTGSFLLYGRYRLDDLHSNTSTQRQMMFSGRVDAQGTCKGDQYTDQFGSWDNVIVQGSVTVTLTDYIADADTNSDKLILRTGTDCILSSGVCQDMVSGYTVWESTPLTSCDRRKHTVLYEGNSTLWKTSEGTSYMVDEGSKIFGLRTTGVYQHCMFEAYTTEHPKLIIVPKQVGHNFYFQIEPVPVSSLDLMVYLNAKLVYIEKHAMRTHALMYKELSIQRCNLERQQLNTLLTLAVISPTEFAYQYMESPGFTAIKAGSVLHITQCAAVPVILRPSLNHCYDEMPVSYKNESYFLTPRSRLLQAYGTEINCDEITSPQFKINGEWYSIGLTRHPVRDPHTLTPRPVTNWKSTSLKNLAKAGLYSYEEAELLRNRIMHPFEQSAITNIITRGVTHASVNLQGISLDELMDEHFVESFAEKIGKKIWGWFSFVGNLTSGMIGIYAICRLLKFTLDTLVHAKALYEVYGLSVAILGAIWDSLTTYLLHRKQYSGSEIPISTPGNPDHTVLKLEEQTTPLALDNTNHQGRDPPTAPEEQTPNNVLIEIPTISSPPAYPRIVRI